MELAAVSFDDAPPTGRLCVQVVHDEEIVRLGLGGMLGERHWVERCLLSHSDNWHEVASIARPDVVVIGLWLPRGHSYPRTDLGVYVSNRVRETLPAARILLIGAPETLPARTVRLAGASGYLNDRSSSDTIACAVWGSGPPQVIGTDESRVVSLTSKEQTILRYVANGWTNGEIADMLNTGTDAVKWHLKNIFRRLKVNTRTEAAAKAYRTDILGD